MKLPTGLSASRPNPADGTSLRMMPMIDVVFLLLVFFLWTSSFDPVEYDLPGSIAVPPQASTTVAARSDQPDPPPVEAFDEIVITVTGASPKLGLMWNDEAIASLQTLRSRVQEIVSLGVQPPLIIDPEANVKLRDTIQVMDAIRAGGGDRILLATEAPFP